ncbi:MAG TPA: aminotransferase class I/II-fold pyridoxal phosphate-dependent enzyme [Ignavibacteria bacterium]|nr:aminotransferase class I/II-fold pyridoxal phosphate-dependent enzyme [Ignavibacteria bacterium]
MKFNPAKALQNYLVFGEFGGVNPSITDSSTYTFLDPKRMEEIFEHEIEGCFLYSRHWNPINKELSKTLARMEDTEAAQVVASGMAAISSTVLQLCSTGDEIISSHTIYGGTYALFKNYLPRFGITVKFINTNNLEEVEKAVNEKVKIIYCESVSNPLLEIVNIPELSKISKKHNIKLVVDNTFSPMIITPKQLGADIIVHSMTKFINGTSDCVAGCICASKEFIDSLTDVASGTTMLLGPVLDSFRAASILKNIHTLHIRMRQHSHNAQYLSDNFEKLGLKVFYPGLKSHKQHELLIELKNHGFGFGGMMVLDMETLENAQKLMVKMQEKNVGYLAVSLGYFKTLFSSPGNSTSSEIPEEEQKEIGISQGLVRISVGLDNDIEDTFNTIKLCLEEIGYLRT